jgi:hypothetical protein
LQTAFLEVVIPPDIIYEETSGDLMVPEGGSAKLVCKARGFPKPRVVWRREDGGEIILRTGPSMKTRGQYVSAQTVLQSVLKYECVYNLSLARSEKYENLSVILNFIECIFNIFTNKSHRS